MRYIFFFVISIFALTVFAHTAFTQNEDRQLSFYADVLLHAKEARHRVMAHEEFNKRIQRQLSRDSLFQDSFDLNRIPLLYTPDSSWRIVTWHLMKKDESGNFGYIQKRGDREIIPLNDRSQYLASQEFGKLYPDRWLGAVYTQIHEIPGMDSIYLLKGINRLDKYSTLYVLELLDVREDEIRFGNQLFENSRGEEVHRRIFEVSTGAPFQMEISDSLYRIVTDHLVAVPYNRGSDIMVNVPDGTYEVLQWENGKWRYKKRLFEQRFQEIPRDSSRMKGGDRDIFGRKKN